jgi:UDP-N-acetylmuramyl tripeptide synthase
VISNVEGANLITGVATALVKGSSISGRADADFYIFETDERYLYQIRQQLPCANLLITNLQKDQVQRNGDPDFIYRKIARVIDNFSMRLFLNGDEPRSCSMADKSDKVVFYGAEKHSKAFCKDDTFVTMPCPKCRSRIRIDYFNNDGMGGFECERCGFTNANGTGDPGYMARDIDFDARSFTINGNDFTMPYDLPYMIYNYAAAAAVCKELAGISEAESAEALKSFKLIGGRIDSIDYKGQTIKYMRFKQENPETLQNFINIIASDPSEKLVVIGFGTVDDITPFYINSFYGYDCNFSALADANVKKFLCVTDTICYDSANCLIYGGVDPDLIEIVPTNDSAKIAEAIAAQDCDNVYLDMKLEAFENLKSYVEKEA